VWEFWYRINYTYFLNAISLFLHAFCLEFLKFSAICENPFDAGWKVDIRENCMKKVKKSQKGYFLIFGISRREIGYLRRENCSVQNWWLSRQKSRREVVNEVPDFSGRYLSSRSDRRNLRKRSEKPIFAPRSFADLLPYKFSFPFFGWGWIRKKGIHSEKFIASSSSLWTGIWGAL